MSRIHGGLDVTKAKLTICFFFVARSSSNSKFSAVLFFSKGLLVLLYALLSTEELMIKQCVNKAGVE